VWVVHLENTGPKWLSNDGINSRNQGECYVLHSYVIHRLHRARPVAGCHASRLCLFGTGRVMRTDVKIRATGKTVTASPAASLHPLTVESAAPAQAVEVHPYMARLDTADTHSLWKPRTKILAS
jgi:hypothetical protein